MSEDQERSRQEEHWRELAQLLGIGPEQPASKPSPAKEPIAPPPVEVKAPPPPPPEPEPVLPEAEIHEEVLAVPPAEESWENPVEEPDFPDEIPPQPEDRPAGMDTEDKPHRGRRRKGRRGRREERRPARVEEEPIRSEDPDEEMPFAEDFDNGGEETEDAAEPVEAPTEDDLDVEATLRDWNVPSWNELIASLYRPDR
jgi:hypothetical protein